MIIRVIHGGPEGLFVAPPGLSDGDLLRLVVVHALGGGPQVLVTLYFQIPVRIPGAKSDFLTAAEQLAADLGDITKGVFQSGELDAVGNRIIAGGRDFNGPVILRSAIPELHRVIGGLFEIFASEINDGAVDRPVFSDNNRGLHEVSVSAHRFKLRVDIGDHIVTERYPLGFEHGSEFLLDFRFFGYDATVDIRFLNSGIDMDVVGGKTEILGIVRRRVETETKIGIGLVGNRRSLAHLVSGFIEVWGGGWSSAQPKVLESMKKEVRQNINFCWIDKSSPFARKKKFECNPASLVVT